MYKLKDIEEYVNKIDCNLDDLNNKNIVLFGSGRIGELVKRRLAENGIRVLFYADNDKNKWGTYIDDIKIISPEDLKNSDLLVVISVDSMYLKQIKNQLDDLKVEYIYYGDIVVKNRLDQIEEVYNLLEDDESKRVYVNVLMHDLLAESCADVYSDNQYFCIPEFIDLPTTHQTFVDCGANVGRTSEKFIDLSEGTFNRIYTFEPSEKNNNALLKRMTRDIEEYALNDDKVVSVNGFVGANSSMQTLIESDESGACDRKASNECDGIKVMQYALDDYFKDKEDIPTFIKADIEGAETEMISGTKNIIKEYTPLLAICIYHSFFDLIEIPKMIKNINSSYSMSVRHHSMRGGETVLYCYKKID